MNSRYNAINLFCGCEADAVYPAFVDVYVHILILRTVAELNYIHSLAETELQGVGTEHKIGEIHAKLGEDGEAGLRAIDADRPVAAFVVILEVALGIVIEEVGEIDAILRNAAPDSNLAVRGSGGLNAYSGADLLGLVVDGLAGE